MKKLLIAAAVSATKISINNNQQQWKDNIKLFFNRKRRIQVISCPLYRTSVFLQSHDLLP